MAEAQNDDASVVREQTEPDCRPRATGHSNAFEQALPTLAKDDIVMSSQVTIPDPIPAPEGASVVATWYLTGHRHLGACASSSALP